MTLKGIVLGCFESDYKCSIDYNNKILYIDLAWYKCCNNNYGLVENSNVLTLPFTTGVRKKNVASSTTNMIHLMLLFFWIR